MFVSIITQEVDTDIAVEREELLGRMKRLQGLLVTMQVHG